MAELVMQDAPTFVKPEFREQYDNFIGGKWVAPSDSRY